MRRGYAALVLLALIWGASFLFIKLAVRDMSPATLVLARALAVAAAAASYAVAALVQRRRLSGVSPLQVGFWQLTLTIPLAVAVALPTIPGTQLHAASIASIIALGAGGSGIAYLLYYYMMNTLGATRATTVTFLLPLTAVFWGATLLHEAITIPIVAGMVVILLGVYLTSRPRGRRAATVVEGRGAA